MSSRVNQINLARAFVVCAASLWAINAAASPTVSGNVISWTEPGWHQVQLQSTYESVCNGGRQCTVPAGVYTVINHGTGERFPNIAVPDNSTDNENGPLAPVTSTGQVTSYAFGDDGDFQAGVAIPGDRFQDNGDGTFTDLLTGITWMSIRDCIVRYSWAGALEYANNLSANSDLCPALNDGSVSGDWRLPNIKELYSLVDISDNSPAWADGIPYTGNNWTESPWEKYWSSSSFQPVPESNAFAMDSGFGLIWSYSKTSVFFAWPIRIQR